MIVKFKNIGKITKTVLDVKPFTVIIGPNNTNKTYLAYTTYGLYKKLNQILPMYLARAFRMASINNVLYISKIDLSNVVTNIKYDEKEYQKNLSNYFQDSSNVIFKKTKINIELDKETIISGLIKIASKGVLFYNNRKTIVESAKGRIYFKQDRFNNPSRYRNYLDELAKEVTNLIIPRVFLLPAERNSLIITYKLLANRRFKLMRDARGRSDLLERTALYNDIFKNEIYKILGEMNYPKPMEDFLDFLSEVDVDYEKPIWNKRGFNIFESLAINIEKNLQEKNTINLKTTLLGGHEIKVGVAKNFDIDLYNASSSIKQLAPLLLYLKYRAQKGDFLIMDEPEMNLHPETQVKLLEILCILTNLGVNILLTTHSPYFMVHLNNLIYNKDTTNVTLKKRAKYLYLKNASAFINEDNVSAYEIKNNELVSLKDNDYGIKWDTLSDVSKETQRKYFQIQNIK